jgi:hypothetical protein
MKEGDANVAAGDLPAVLPPRTRARIFLYLGILISLLAFGAPSGGLIDIPISFFLKNRIRLEASELVNFRLVTSIPLYLSFVFGFVRDCDPLNLGDRGFIVIFSATTAALYVVFAFTPMTYGTLLAGVLLLTTSFLFVVGAQNRLTCSIAQHHAMSGQISAVWNCFLVIPSVASLLIGGVLSAMLEDRAADDVARILFLSGAAIMGAVAVYGFWKPRFVLNHLPTPRSMANPLRDVWSLINHWPVYPALLIWLLWNFAPGAATPLQYYLQDALKGEDAQWGQWNAIFTASFAPTFLLLGILCQRIALRRLLLRGTVVAIPQMVPLLFIKSIAGALIAAVPIGLMGGVATAAYIDLIIRVTPRGMEGTTLMISSSLFFISSRFGDVLGTNIYNGNGGFAACVIAITLVYALILPVILLIPKDIMAKSDG